MPRLISFVSNMVKVLFSCRIPSVSLCLCSALVQVGESAWLDAVVALVCTRMEVTWHS